MACPRLPRHAGSWVLALDLATRCGWALGEFGDRPTSGSVVLGGADVVHRMAALREFLDTQDGFRAISAIVVEAALAGQHKSADAADLLISLQSMARLWAYDMSVPIVLVPASTARKDMIGTGRFPKGEAKRHVAEWVERAGYLCPTHDAADAIVTWLAVERATLGKPTPAPGMFIGSG
jgi:crossover junction endodeoxyribonuclease RuvC